MPNASPWSPGHLPPWFRIPVPVSGGQATLFPSRVSEVICRLQVSADELLRWHQRGWVSFGPERTGSIEEWDADEIRFVRDVVRSGLPDAQIERLFSQLPRPMNFCADAVAYSFGLGWVMVLPQQEADEIVDAHVEEWLQGLAEAGDVPRIVEIRELITELLARDEYGGSGTRE